jgi:hypothetical protein
MVRARILVGLASLALFLAVLAGYADRALFNSDQFADRATDALRDDRVRSVVAEGITDDLVLNAEADLIAARPLIESVASGVVGSDAFTGVFRAGVRDLHRAVFDGDEDTLTLTLADAATLVRAALGVLRPALAEQIDRDEHVQLLDNEIGAVTGDLVRLAEDVQLLALIMLLLTLLLGAAAIWVAADRRRTVTDLGIGAAAVGVLIVLLYAFGRGTLLDLFDDPQAHDAAEAVWDAYLGDLRRAGWVLAVSGVVAAAAAASLIRPIEIEEPLRRVWEALAREPEATWARVARAAGLVAAGIVVLADREAVLQLLFTLVGAYLVYAGIVAILRLVYRPEPEAELEPAPASRRGRRFAVAAIAVLVVGVSVTAFAATGGTSAPDEEPINECNGSAELCDRPLAAVAVPATHNAMSAPLPGWFSAQQDKPIPGQLEAGVRGLLIDTHYGDKLSGGKVRTDFGSREQLERRARQDGVSADALDAALRTRERLGFSGEGQRGMYLCHSFCELGATPLDEVLGQIEEFLVSHPGEVLVVINQDYVKPADFVAAVKQAGLAGRAYGGRLTAKTPTLREMIDSGRRIVFLAENKAGAAPWYRLAYEQITEETPYSFGSTGQLTNSQGLEKTCRPNRGPSRGAPLFLLNHWVTTDPIPLPSNAAKVNARGPLLRRARECQRVRGQLPNLIAVDFFGQGDLFQVVAELNRVPRASG